MPKTPPRQSQPIALPRRYPLAPLVGVGVAVFNRAGEVLLVKRGRPPRQGQWGLPGGLIDLGERLVDAARREVREECGVEVEMGDLVAAFEPMEWDGEGRVEYHYVVLDYWAAHRAGEPVAQDDADEAAWVALPALEQLAVSAETRDVIVRAHGAWSAAGAC
ncbi:MAG: NUDIX hydrolase [Caldilineaceae bacterium]|nr:NUDIX hydrolase [Caldilineaceae bacterium]